MVRPVEGLLAHPFTNDAAEILKAWRKRERLSQTEAAIRLGVSVRTLQGWELGRPMPYPGLLQIGVTVAPRPADPFTLAQSEFPREFASFVDFVGADELQSALQRATTKLASLLSSTRRLYGDRYFFHEQFNRFAEGSAPFQLNISDPVAVRAASLIVGVNRIRSSLSATGASRFRKAMIGNLRPDRDMRQLEHEIRCYAHFGRKGFKVTFADLEGLGRFDLVVETPSTPIEVECKTVSDDTGSQIKLEMTVNLAEAFLKDSRKRIAAKESGIFVLTFKRPSSDCKNLVQQFKEALRSVQPGSFDGTDFALVFSPRAQWTELINSERLDDLHRCVSLDSDLIGHAHCYTRVAGLVLGLSLRPHKASGIAQRVVDVIKEGADQCTGRNPSVIWLHFIGAAEAEFISLAQFSMDGKGAGLNNLVASSLHPQASPTDRSHVHTVRFSAASDRVANSPTLAPSLLIVRGVSSTGTIYDVPNPLCRLPQTVVF
jgi:transcriptional regulator with XRE-family HTH domain